MKARHLFLTASISLLACGDDSQPPTGTGLAVGGSGSGASGSGANGAGGAGGAEGGGATGGGGSPLTDLDDLLARLRADRDGTLLEESFAGGWPAQVAEGLVVVSAQPTQDNMAGDFSAWAPVALTEDDGFRWGLMPDAPGRYKLTDGDGNFSPDPWSRGFAYDEFGEISEVPSGQAHLERFFEVGLASPLAPRVVRVWVPQGAATHVLYLHDGQNLFNPDAIWGGWRLDEAAPAGMMLVGIDNTAARMDEYTQVPDDIGSTVGGLADDYAALIEDEVRPLIAAQYGEPAKVGTLGSSLGGLISLHIGLSYPSGYDFVGSMSGTLGWGSIGPTHTGETMIEHYDEAAVQPFAIYLDSGGAGPCADSDADGIEDDGSGTDNFCETEQMRDVLSAAGYIIDDNLFHWHEPGAPHNEQAWADRVFRPLAIFAAL